MQTKDSLVILHRLFKFTQKYVCVSEVALSSPFSGFIVELNGNF